MGNNRPSRNRGRFGGDYPPKTPGNSTSIYTSAALYRLTLMFLLCGSDLLAETLQETLPKADSSNVYSSIETFSKKRTFTKFLYGLLLVPGASNLFRNKPVMPIQKSHKNFEGKIIRAIHVVTMDPFGYSVDDSTAKPEMFALRAANALHVSSQNFVIRNGVLLRKNEPYDSLLVKESERLIRSRKYVREVLFETVPVEKSMDSVDIHIKVLDKWSIIPNGAVSAQRATFGLTENNLVGFGHEIDGTYTRNHTNGEYAFAANYFVPNISTSYINTLLHYEFDENNNFAKSVSVERPLYSPLAKWAAGLHIGQQFSPDTTVDTLPNIIRQNQNFVTQDYWAGIAFSLFKANTEDARTTNAIIAARYLRIRHLEKPDDEFDYAQRYSDEDFYLIGIGIATLNYFRNNFIFDFGAVEDVPVGRIYEVTAGYQMRGTIARLYAGSRISFGDYTKWGYASSTIEYGTFFRRLHCQQGVFAASVNFASNLFEIGNWRIRQFAKPQVALGLNRFSYDSLTINDENGIRGFESSLSGTKKLVMTFQTQSYAPWNVLGFRFGPFLMYSAGMLGNATSGFKNSRLYSQIGIGTLIKNKYFVLSDFQVSLSYYPSIPGKGYDILKLNSFGTTDFGFGDFNYGKPQIAPFH